MVWQYVWLAACWLAFGLQHSIFAAGRVKYFFQKAMKGHYRFYRLYYSVFSFSILAYIIFLLYSYTGMLLWQPLLFQRIVAVITGIAGLYIVIACIKKYFFQLSGVHVLYKEENKNILYINGINRFVRHPLYTGTLLLIWSIFLWLPLLTFFISALMASVYTIIGARFEERKLCRIFGQQYIQYKQQVPMFLPKVL